jgi:WhiB family redox-sensing transcriptional regulator
VEADWAEQGKCHRRKRLLPLFYSDLPSEQKVAKALCFSCPVQTECLQAALDNNERFGIWGGLLPAERKRLKGKL